MHTIAIDCGASFVKGALFSEEGNILARLQSHAPTVRQNSEITEPIQIMELLSLIEKMLIDLADAGRERRYKLCISNEMHGFLLADAKGNPLTDYISWQKEYGNLAIHGTSAIEKLKEEQRGEDILYTGMNLRGGLPSCNLLYLWLTGFFDGREEEIYFYTLGDYVLKKLSGREPLCHPTNAAATGLFDLRRGDWNQNLTARYEEKKVVFPQVGQEPMPFELDNRMFHAYPAIGDQQAALLGAGLHSADEVSFNLGTGAQVSRLTYHVEPNSAYQIRPYFEGSYLKSIPYLPSGRALNVYIRFVKGILEQFGIEDDEDGIWAKVLEAEKNAKDTLLKCDLSFFENPVTPFHQGSIKNIAEYELTLGNLFRAVFKQMADNFCEAADKLCEGQAKVEKLIFSGGVARRIAPIRRMVAERYGDGIKCVVIQDETLTGLYRYGTLKCEI